MIVKETERAKEKKEKQKKKQNQNMKITRRNERKNIELDNRKIASEMPWRCPLLSFLIDFVPKSSGTERRRYRNEGLGGFLGPSASR